MLAPLVLVVDDNAELAELLAQILEEAGYRTKVAHRGKTALNLAQREVPALAIVDILLPDVTGYEVGEELARRNVPFMFMTGVFKGGRHALDGTRRRGARGYFEKPFKADQLVAAVREIVPPALPPLRAPALRVSREHEVGEGEYTPMMPITMTGKVAVRNEVVSAVLTGRDVHLRAPTAASVYVRPGETGPKDPASPEERTRRGELRDNLPQLITAFATSGESGELGLMRGKVRKVIYFEKGQPVFALSNLAADRFGSFLVRAGKITREQLQQAADRSTRERRRTGDVLIDMGLLREAEKLFYVAQQVKAILYSVFSWEDGDYVISFQDKARAEPLRLGLHPAHLIQRGVKKMYNPARLSRLVKLEDRPMPAANPDFQLSELELEPWEAHVLSRVTGDRTVAELMALSGKEPAQVLASLVALISLRILEKRRS